MLENSISLHDAEGDLHRIMADLSPYPTALRKTLIASSLNVIRGSLEDMQDYISRNIGNTAFLFHLWRVIDAMADPVVRP